MLVGLGLVAAVASGAVVYSALKPRPAPFVNKHKEVRNPQPAPADTDPAATPSDQVSVEIIHPHQGGIDLICVQPGTVEAIKSADLYAKVSGFLIEEGVDIGSRVKAGQQLARIAVPEHEKQVLKDEAELDHVKARVKQMMAKITAVEAEARAATSSVVLAEAQLTAKASFRSFRKKQLDRMRELLAKDAVDARLVDESEDQYQSAFSSETAAKEAVTTAKLQVASADAKVMQAKADLDEAKANVRVAEAELERVKVLLAYSIIKAPFDGVITHRNFFPGDFIRAADGGSDRRPLFTIEKTDQMRIIIQVPDRDVKYLNVGDPAKVEIDALPGKKFEAVVARRAEREDPATRAMHTEVDVPNPDGALSSGMYGKATLLLEPGNKDALTIPTSALDGKAGDGHATARVVRDGKALLVPVRVGLDNGINIEVLEGLRLDDTVIVHSSAPLEDGTPVVVQSATKH